MKYAFWIFLLLAGIKSHATALSEIFDHYKSLNDKETRLIDFKDSDNDLQLKLNQIAVINESRKKHNCNELQLDILASRVANKMCKEAAENNYVGHWNMAGEKPYHRYAFAGGKDHIVENAAAKWVERGFGSDNQTTLNTMNELHKLFMSERAPDDGHKKNCLNKMHNYVGIGFYKGDKEFTYYEEFIDRYFEFDNIPETVKAGEKFSIKVSPQPGQYLLLLLAYFEKMPEPMSVKSINRKTSYPDFSNKEALRIYPWELAKMRNENAYTIELKFDKPGLYYIHIYQNNVEIKTEKAFNTEGKTEGSGIVIKVE